MGLRLNKKKCPQKDLKLKKINFCFSGNCKNIYRFWLNIIPVKIFCLLVT